MIKTFLSRAAVIIVASLSLFMVSCVQEEYEISEETLNLEVTVFQEGVALPLGSTDAIKIGEILDQYATDEIKEMFPVGDDGSYAFGMSDNFDFSEDLAFLSESFAIDAFGAKENIPFDLSSVDVSDVKVDKIEVGVEKMLSEEIEPVDFELDPITPEPFKQTTDISSYLPGEEQLQININEYEYSGTIATINDIDVPLENTGFQMAMAAAEMTADTEYPLQAVVDLLDAASNLGLDLDLGLEQHSTFELKEPISVPVEIKLPEMIQSVEDIHLHEGAQLRITVDLCDNLFFTSGAIVPHVDIDIHEIFHLTKEENDKHPLEIDHIVDDFELSHDSVQPGNTSNTYYVSHTYDIESLVIDKSKDFETVDGCVVFKKDFKVQPTLALDYKDLKTSLAYLDAHEGGPVTMTIKVEFLNFEVDDVSVVVKPIETEITTDFELNVKQELPDMVKGVQEVTFAEGSGVDIKISAVNIDRIDGLDVNLDNLKLTFPEGIQVEGTDADNVLLLPIGSLHDGTTEKTITVTGITLGDAVQEGDKYFVAFDGKVLVEGQAVVGVADNKVIHTKDLPTVPEQDIALGVDVKAEFEIDDFKVDFEGYYYEVNEEEVIEFEVGKEVADLGEVLIYPETVDGDEPVITIDIQLPDTQLPIGPSEKGLVIDFPDMIVFKNLAPELQKHYSSAGNILTFTEELPSHIELPIDYILAEAKPKTKTDKDGKEVEVYVVEDKFTVTGEVGVAPGIVVKGDVDALTAPDAVVSFKAFVPEMVPSLVNIDSYQAVIEGDPVKFGEEIDLSALPKELVSVGEILLKDVFLNIDVKAPGINSLITDADVNLNLEVALPDAIMLPEGVVDADNVLHVDGKLENEQIVVDPIQIYGLRLNKTSEELTEYLKGIEITYKGTVTVSDASIDMGALEDSELNLDVNINLATEGAENIEIATVTGNVNYAIEPVRTEVDLSSLTEVLNTENMSATLDLNRFSLALDLTTNLSVPLLAKLSILPYKDGAVLEDEVLEEDLVITMPEASSEPSLIRFWISNYEKGQDPYMPEGYEHIKLDILKLIPLAPEKLEIVLDAGTDPGKLCSIAPSEEGYVLEAAYAFNLPFEFGDNMALEFRQVIEDLPAELGTILQYGSLALTGEIESSLPLGLDMTYNFLDSEGNVIALAEKAGHQTIQPGTLTGEAVKTPLNILVGINKDADVSDISSLELVFKALSVPGAPVKSDSYIKATLQALIPEGVTVDAAQFLKKDEVEN